MRYRTPLLVPTSKSFDSYLPRLSKPAKKNYIKANKLNMGKEFKVIPYDHELIIQFMILWTEQYVYGVRPTWVFGPEHFKRLAEAGQLICFASVIGNEIYGLHPVEVCDGYAYSQPPMYEKIWGKDYLPTWMWFKAIEYLCNQTDVEEFDLGGAFNGTWRNLLRIKDDPRLKNLHYKWRYVPADIKNNPDTQPEYEAFDCDCLKKQLVVGRTGCQYCGKGRIN